MANSYLSPFLINTTLKNYPTGSAMYKPKQSQRVKNKKRSKRGKK